MIPYIKLTHAGLRSFVRDRAALFWSFFFPVFFIMIFGSIMGKSDKGGSGRKFTIYVVSEDPSPTVAWIPEVFETVPVFEVKHGTMEVAQKDLLAGDSSATVQLLSTASANLQSGRPVDVVVTTDPAKPQIGPIVSGIVRNVLAGMDKTASGTPTIFNYVEGKLTVNTNPDDGPQSGIDFLLPGILAMTIMQLGLFTAVPMIAMREKGILKRFRATPLPRSTVIAAQVTQRLLIAVIQASVIIGLGVAMFGFHMRGSWIVLLGLIIFGVLSFISIGAVVASIAKTAETGVSLVQLVNFPMMFLSGLFFPVTVLPDVLKPVVMAMPATYMADLLRYVMVNAPLAHPLLMDLGILGTWMAACLYIASRLFKWE